MAVGPIIGVPFSGNDLEQNLGALADDLNRAFWAIHAYLQSKSVLLGNGSGSLAALPRTIDGVSQPFNDDEIFLIDTVAQKLEELFNIYTGAATLGSVENYMELVSPLFGSGR